MNKVKPNQSLLDKALESNGDVGSFIDIALENGKAIDEELSAGEELKSAGEVNEEIASTFLKQAPANGETSTFQPPTQPPLNPNCDDAEVEVNGQYTVLAPSGQSTPISIVNSYGTLLNFIDVTGNVFTIEKAQIHAFDEDGNSLATFPIDAGTTEPYTAPSGDIEINGTVETDVLSGGLTKVNVKDQDGNALNPTVTSAGGRDVDLEVNVGGGTTHWVRNPDWPSIPNIDTISNKLYLVFGVYENDLNSIGLIIYGPNKTINWGDGIQESVFHNTNTYHYYDYDSISIPVKVDVDGRNYKPVLLELDLELVYLVNLNLKPPNVSSPSAKINILDIVANGTSLTDFYFSGAMRPVKLERVICTGLTGQLQYNQNALYLSNLRIFDLGNSQFGTVYSPFMKSRGRFDIRDRNGDVINVDQDGSVFFGMFLETSQKQIGNITSTGTTCSRVFFQSDIQAVGDITIINAIQIDYIFYKCTGLSGTVRINTSPALTNIRNAFYECSSVYEVVITDCSNVTNTASVFYNNHSMVNLILNGLTVGIDVSNASMNQSGLDSFFNSLGNANGSQTITISGNPGAATCDTTIATNKGFTVVI